MKKTIYSLICALGCIAGIWSLTACDDDTWGNDNEEMMNVFYFGFENWGQLKNDVTYTVKQGQIVDIPMQFWCAGERSFDAIALYYVDSSLTLGTDFQIVDENGNSLQPDSNGAFTMQWNLQSPDATNNHRIQNIRVKALQGKTGKVTVTTFNPRDVDGAGKVKISNGSSDGIIYTPNYATGEYEVHCLTQNYKAVVTIEK
jgi:hypothetical protein